MVSMAHVAGHRGETSPYNYPSSAPSDRDHGANSEYETLNIPYKMHTKFVSDSEIPDDVIPLMPAPAASWPPVEQTDPALCITPDKASTGHGNLFSNVFSTKGTIPSLPKPDPCLCLTPEQSVNAVSRVRPNATRYSSDMTPTQPTLVEADPLLTVTPEKPTPITSKTKSSLRTDKSDAEVKQKMKCKVRFDIDLSQATLDNNVLADVNVDKTVGNKVYEPRLYSGMDKSHDAFFGNDDQPRRLVFTVVSSEESRRSDQNLHLALKGSAYDKSFERSDADNMKLKIKTFSNTSVSESNKPVEIGDRSDFIIPDTNKCPPKHKVVVTRELQERPVITEYQYPFDCTNDTSDMEHVFSRPEFHNSLKVYSEMKEIGSMVPDVDTALHRQLKVSEETRTEISEKASAKVNQRFSSCMYAGLVRLETSIGDLCLHTEKQITMKARPTKYQSKKQAADHGPDLMEFFNTELEKEASDLHLTDVNIPSEDIAIASQSLAFDLYRHNRVWDGTDWK